MKKTFPEEGVYWVADLTGLLDMRNIKGPYKTLRDSLKVAFNLHRKRKDFSALVDTWFALHPKGTMMWGPFPSRKFAELGRKDNLKENAQECNGDKGFTALLVDTLYDVGIFTSDPKGWTTETWAEFNAEFPDEEE